MIPASPTSPYGAAEVTLEDDVRCVIMPCCGFTFDEVHHDWPPGEDERWSCPACAQIELREALVGMVAAFTTGVFKDKALKEARAVLDL